MLRLQVWAPMLVLNFTLHDNNISVENAGDRGGGLPAVYTAGGWDGGLVSWEAQILH